MTARPDVPPDLLAADYSAATPGAVVHIRQGEGPVWPKRITIFGTHWSVRPSWDARAPFATGPPNAFMIYVRPGLDHLYRLVGMVPVRGVQVPPGTRERQAVYVTEPYDIGPAEIRTFAALVASGWDVQILPRAAIWYPGHTTAVWCRQRVRGRGQRP